MKLMSTDTKSMKDWFYKVRVVKLNTNSHGWVILLQPKKVPLPGEYNTYFPALVFHCTVLCPFISTKACPGLYYINTTLSQFTVTTTCRGLWFDGLFFCSGNNPAWGMLSFLLSPSHSHSLLAGCPCEGQPKGGSSRILYLVILFLVWDGQQALFLSLFVSDYQAVNHVNEVAGCWMVTGKKVLFRGVRSLTWVGVPPPKHHPAFYIKFEI